MSTYTENYNLIKPAEDDRYDVQEFNDNMDAIDMQMAETEAEIANVSEKIGSAEDTGTDTVFGKLNQMTTSSKEGFTTIRSIQKFFCSSPQTFALQPVIPENCIVYINRLQDISGSGSGGINYTLSSTELKVETLTYLKVEFWIIEFN